MAARRHAYTVSGPGVDVGYNDAGPALSRSITEASRVKHEATFYVRDVKGDPIGYSEQDADGVVRTHQRDS